LYFPDLLRDRQVELVYLGNVLPLGPKPGLARSFYIVIKNIEINREIYHRKRENIAGNHHPLRPPLNSQEKLTNKVKKE